MELKLQDRDRHGVSPKYWGIIPAAGKGSRLDFEGPKFMYPVGGQPMIDRLMAMYADYAEACAVVEDSVPGVRAGREALRTPAGCRAHVEQGLRQTVVHQPTAHRLVRAVLAFQQVLARQVIHGHDETPDDAIQVEQ